MATALIAILILACFALTLVLRRYEHTWLYVGFCALAFLYFLGLTIMKAKTAPAHLTVLGAGLTVFILWRTIRLTVEMRRAQNENSQV